MTRFSGTIKLILKNEDTGEEIEQELSEDEFLINRDNPSSALVFLYLLRIGSSTMQEHLRNRFPEEHWNVMIDPNGCIKIPGPFVVPDHIKEFKENHV
jgi:hypothetical protein